MDIPTVGKHIIITAIDIVRIAGGMDVKHWHNSDDLGILQQLAVVPMLGQAH